MESFSLKRVVSQIWGTQICCTICCFPMKSLHTKVNTVGVLADGDAIDRERERERERECRRILGILGPPFTKPPDWLKGDQEWRRKGNDDPQGPSDSLSTTSLRMLRTSLLVHLRRSVADIFGRWDLPLRNPG